MGPRRGDEDPGLTPMPPDTPIISNLGEQIRLPARPVLAEAKSLLYLIVRGPVMAGLLDKGRPTADDPAP